MDKPGALHTSASSCTHPELADECEVRLFNFFQVMASIDSTTEDTVRGSMARWTDHFSFPSFGPTAIHLAIETNRTPIIPFYFGYISQRASLCSRLLSPFELLMSFSNLRLTASKSEGTTSALLPSLTSPSDRSSTSPCSSTHSNQLPSALPCEGSSTRTR